MDDFVVNERAMVHAYELIDHRRFVVGTDWPHCHPTPAQQQAFVDGHSWDAHGLWHLVIAQDCPEGTLARHRFAYGDFVRVHRSALTNCLERARQGGLRPLQDAALELLRRLDAKAGIPGDPD